MPGLLHIREVISPYESVSCLSCKESLLLTISKGLFNEGDLCCLDSSVEKLYLKISFIVYCLLIVGYIYIYLSLMLSSAF